MVEMMGKFQSIILPFFILFSIHSSFTAAFRSSFQPLSSSVRTRSLHSLNVPVKYNQLNSNLNSNFNNNLKSNLQMRSVDSPSALHAFFDGKSNVESATQSVPNINKLFVRCSWISWWFQIILSVVSAVILTFANSVRQGG
jgi:hypothetical protein